MERVKNTFMTNIRQSNIELLRIVAMLIIVAHHIAFHSDFAFGNTSISFNRLWVQFIEMGGKIGVNIFVLISGYFGVSSAYIKKDKVVKLWLQIFSYSVLCFLIAILFLGENLGLKSLIKSFLPITFSQWWFASTYFVLYLLSPFINRFLKSLDQKTYRNFLLLLFFMWCFIPTFLSTSWEANPLLWFVFLYSCSGYIRLHLNVSTYKKSFVWAGIMIFLTYLSVVVFDILGTKISLFASHATYFYGMEKLPALLISILLFVGFLNLKIGYQPMINMISSATFGVYLIHDNDYIRDFLWIRLFKNQNYASSKFLAPYTILQVIIVFVVCILIELFRINLIEKRYGKCIEWLLDYTEKFLNKVKSTKLYSKIVDFV